MLKAEKDIIIYKKSAKIAHEVIKKLWNSRQEFSPMLEQIVLETLRENLEIISASHQEKLEFDLGIAFNLKAYLSHQTSMKIGEIVETSNNSFINTLEETSEDGLRIKQTKFLIVMR